MPLYNAQLHFQQALSVSTTTVWLWCIQTLPKQSPSSQVVALLEDSVSFFSSLGFTPPKTWLLAVLFLSKKICQ